MKDAIDRLRLLAAACCLASASSQAGDNPQTPMQLKALSDIDALHISEQNQVMIQSGKGICLFLLRLAPGSNTLEIHFFYRSEQPFEKIEGIQIHDNRTDRKLDAYALQASGRLTIENGVIRLRNNPQGVDWLVRVIDYYR